MRAFWRRLQRVELGLELALIGVILELFHRGIRPGLDIGCGSLASELSDDLLFLVSDYRLSLVIPVIVIALELRVAFRPWVKRAVRLGAGLTFVAMLLSYSVLVWSFIDVRTLPVMSREPTQK